MYVDNNDTISVISASFTASVDFRHERKGFNKCIALFLGKLIFILVDLRLGLCCKIDRLIKAN